MDKWIILLLGVLLVSGCTSTASPVGVMLSVHADPSIVFLGSPTTLFIDIDNQDTKSIENVVISVFDTGLLRGSPCGASYNTMLPFEFKSTKCIFTTPSQDEIREPTQTEVNTLVKFDATFSAVQLVDIITPNEYQRRVDTNDYRPASKTYSYRDRNVLVDVEFSDTPPFIMAPGKKYFIYFTITNTGSGFIREVTEDDFRVLSNDLLYCPPRGTLEPDGRTFPRIACEIVIPDNYLEDKSASSAQFVIDFLYNYELRNSIKVDLIK